jgi:hypothetical protein
MASRAIPFITIKNHANPEILEITVVLLANQPHSEACSLLFPSMMR